MPVYLLVQPRTALQYLLPLALGDTGAIIIDPHLVALGIRRDTQPHLAVGPLAGVVQQVAEQLQEVLAVPRQQQPGRHIPGQQQALAMDHAQRPQQPRQLDVAVELRARQRIPRQARTVQLTRQALLNLLQLLAHLRANIRQVLQALAGGQAQQHRQWRLQCMAQVAQGIARAAQAVFGMAQQVVDLPHQRRQFAGHFGIQLRALALLQLGDLLACPLQWPQRAGHGDALQHQHQDQRHQAHAQADLLQAPETFAYRRIILCHADRDVLAQAPVVGTQGQQLLAFRAEFVAVGKARRGGLGHVQIPQRTGAPGAFIEIDAEVIAGKRPLIGGRDTPLIQLQARRPAHQGHQQVFAFLAQAVLQVALQADLEQPQGQLRQHQADHHQHRHQAQAQARLDRLHSALPA
ncbi:hypothetical protein D3C79_469770 [compost metagenome]